MPPSISTAGKIKLSGTEEPFTFANCTDKDGKAWSALTQANECVITVKGGLGFGKSYKLDIYDFKNLTSDKMDQVYSYNFTTAKAPSIGVPALGGEAFAIGNAITATPGDYIMNGGAAEGEHEISWTVEEDCSG